MNDPRPIRIVPRPLWLTRQTIEPRNARQQQRDPMAAPFETYLIAAIVAGGWLAAYFVWRSL